MMPSNSLCVSNPLSSKERWVWPSNQEGQEAAEAHPLGALHGPLLLVSLSSLLDEGVRMPRRDSQGQDPPREAAWLLL